MKTTPLFAFATVAMIASPAAAQSPAVTQLSETEVAAGISLIGTYGTSMAQNDTVLVTCSPDLERQVMFPVTIIYDFKQAARNNIDGERRAEIPQILKEELLSNMTDLLRSSYPLNVMLSGKAIDWVLPDSMTSFRAGVAAAFRTSVNIRAIYHPILVDGCALHGNALTGETTLGQFMPASARYASALEILKEWDLKRRAKENPEDLSLNPI